MPGTDHRTPATSLHYERDSNLYWAHGRAFNAFTPTRLLRSAREAIVGKHGEGWKVRVTAAPENGKANDAVLRLLADRLELPIKSVTLVSGPSSRDKIVELTGVDAAEAERRLGQPR